MDIITSIRIIKIIGIYYHYDHHDHHVFDDDHDDHNLYDDDHHDAGDCADHLLPGLLCGEGRCQEMDFPGELLVKNYTNDFCLLQRSSVAFFLPRFKKSF